MKIHRIHNIIHTILIIILLTTIVSGQFLCEIRDVNHKLLTGFADDEIEIYVDFKNIDTVIHTYTLKVYDDTYPPGVPGNLVYTKPGGSTLDPGEIKIVKITSNWLPWDKYQLGKNYTIVIWDDGAPPNYYDITVPLQEDTPRCIACSSPSGKCTADKDGYIRQKCAIDCEDTFMGPMCITRGFVCGMYNFGYDYTCADGSNPEVTCSTDDDCKILCAQMCGKNTGCYYDCNDCCSGTSCNKLFPKPYDADEMNACVDVCRGYCDANVEFCKVIRMLQIIMGGICALMITLNGIKWTVSDDEAGRKSAKQGIIYTIAGLVLLLVGTALVDYLYVGSITCGPIM